jgi:hypothetical protein
MSLCQSRSLARLSEQPSPAGLDHSAALMRGTCKCIGDNALYGTLLKTQEIEDVRVLAARGAVRNSPLRRSSPAEIGLTRYARP